MLCLDDIKKLIGIEDVEIKKIEKSSSTVTVNIEKPRQNVVCPVCGKETFKVHDYRMQTIKDISAFGHAVKLLLRKRRYRCSCGKCFDEKYSFLPRYYRMTRRLIAEILSQLSESVTYTHVARHVGVSVTTFIRIFDTVSYPSPNQMPRVLSIDEFRGNLGEKYQCILTDAENGKVIDILPSRQKAKR